jgi:hypothetical protein
MMYVSRSVRGLCAPGTGPNECKNAENPAQRSSSLSAREAITALGLAGHRVEVVSADALCLGRFSRFVRRVHRVAASGADPDGYLAAVLDIVKTRSIDVVLPVHEQDSSGRGTHQANARPGKRRESFGKHRCRLRPDAASDPSAARMAAFRLSRGARG